MLSLLRRRRRKPSTPVQRAAQAVKYSALQDYIPAPARSAEPPSKAYNIHDTSSPDWYRFVVDAAARGYDVHIDEWHRSHFGSFTNVYVRRLSDGLIIPADAATIWAAGIEIWDQYEAYFETLERARDRSFAAGKPFTLGSVPGRPDWPITIYPGHALPAPGILAQIASV